MKERYLTGCRSSLVVLCVDELFLSLGTLGNCRSEYKDGVVKEHSADITSSGKSLSFNYLLSGRIKELKSRQAYNVLRFVILRMDQS